MEGLRRRRNALLALQREFTGSRLEKQILMHAFALLVPVDGSEPITEEPQKRITDLPLVIPDRSQGGYPS
jgi:hypothetical protein